MCYDYYLYHVRSNELTILNIIVCPGGGLVRYRVDLIKTKRFVELRVKNG